MNGLDGAAARQELQTVITRVGEGRKQPNQRLQRPALRAAAEPPSRYACERTHKGIKEI